MFRKPHHSSSHLVNSRLVGATALAMGMVIPGSILALSANAEQFPGGQSFFDHAPRLVRTAASFHSVNTPSTYQFTVKVPEDAGANLQALKIAQDQETYNVSFDPNQSTAFLGNSFAGGPKVPLASIGGEMPAGSDAVTVVFDPPIAPGQTVTVSLQANRNPQDGGVYLFGVTAFPEGESNRGGLFLGYGQVNVYENSR
jgi:hypothetical protein